LPLFVAAVLTGAEAKGADHVLVFDALHTEVAGDRLEVTWRVTNGSWDQVRELHPKLVVYVSDDSRPVDIEVTYTVPMDRTLGEASLPLVRAWEPTRAELYITSDSALVNLSVNHVVARRIAVQVGREVARTPSRSEQAWRRPQTCPGVSPTKIATTCGEVLPGAESVGCIEVASSACFDPVSGVRACGAAFHTEEDVLGCVSAMAEAPADPTSLIGACSSAFTAPANQLACVDLATESQLSPTVGIQVCATAFSNPGLRLACVRNLSASPRLLTASALACAHILQENDAISCLGLASKAEFEPSEAILACGEVVSGSTALTQCATSATGAVLDPSGLIRQCGANSASVSSTLACIRAGVP